MPKEIDYPGCDNFILDVRKCVDKLMLCVNCKFVDILHKKEAEKFNKRLKELGLK